MRGRARPTCRFSEAVRSWPLSEQRLRSNFYDGHTSFVSEVGRSSMHGQPPCSPRRNRATHRRRRDRRRPPCCGLPRQRPRPVRMRLKQHVRQTAVRCRSGSCGPRPCDLPATSRSERRSAFFNSADESQDISWWASSSHRLVSPAPVIFHCQNDKHPPRERPGLRLLASIALLVCNRLLLPESSVRSG